MDEVRPKVERPWREIAEEVAACGSEKLAELSLELIDALDRDKKRRSEQMLAVDETQVRRQSA